MARNSSSIWGSSDADCSSGANSQNDAHHLNADAQGRGAPTQGREEEAIASGLHQPCACWFCASPLNQPPGLAVHPLWGRREQGQKRWLKDFRKGLKCEIRKTVAGMREAAVAMYALEWEGQHASRVEACILFQTKSAQHGFSAQRQHDLDYYGHVADFSKKTYGPLSPQEQQWNLELRQEEEELGEETDYSVIWLFIDQTERERNENKAVSAQKGAAAGSSASAPAAKAPPPLFQSQPPAPARVTMYRDPHRRWTFAARPLMARAPAPPQSLPSSQPPSPNPQPKTSFKAPPHVSLLWPPHDKPFKAPPSSQPPPLSMMPPPRPNQPALLPPTNLMSPPVWSHGGTEVVFEAATGRPAGSATAITRAQTTAPKTKKATFARVSAAPPDCPMPIRIVPHILNFLHQIVPNSYLDIDWTVSPDWEEEQSRRTHHNILCIAELKEGKPVVLRSSGNSLYPRVCSNDICTFFPVTSEKEVREGDIVFCSVQPYDRICGHLVKRKRWLYQPWGGKADANQYVYTISNISGYENGWCTLQHIYGKLVEDCSQIDL